jgi:trehalose/maltose hydrolase-like predicted phosphorylase
LKSEGKSPDDYKLSKQADLLMTFYNLGETEVTCIINRLGYSLPDNYLERNFAYYMARTSHGSTLSRLVHGRLAYELGMEETGWTLFMDSLKSDLVDIQGGTTGEGIHCGVMAGTVYELISTFAGVSLKGNIPVIKPHLPEKWKALRFHFSFKGIDYSALISRDEVNITAHFSGEAKIKVDICGENVSLASGEQRTIKIG